MPHKVITPLILVTNHLSPYKLITILLILFPFPFSPIFSLPLLETIPLVCVSMSLFLVCFVLLDYSSF